ncbi:hypothetical protein C8R45DRAFT_1178268 [Mycena sanguinolenta]|nr:hypothetical protein C8R45DRAFT_1178268 [Mycena sanguinolenta]
MSLLLFFSGLVAFFIPVNLAMAIIAVIILAIVAIVYCTITLLPLQYLDCPYQTPLSGIFWNLVPSFRSSEDKAPNDREADDSSSEELSWKQKDKLGFRNLWGAIPYFWPSQAKRHSPSGQEADSLSVESLHKQNDKMMVEAMSCTAMKSSKGRSDRDYKALVWTMQSLTDDRELEPFIEAIPDLLWGPAYRHRHIYDLHIRGLVHNPDVHLLDRIQCFLQNCYTDVLPAEARQHRIIASHKAFWAIASLSDFAESSGMVNAPPLDFTPINTHINRVINLIAPLPDPQSSIYPYSLSATTMILWSMFHMFKHDLLKAQKYLADEFRHEDISELNSIGKLLWHMCSGFGGVYMPEVIRVQSLVMIMIAGVSNH